MSDKYGNSFVYEDRRSMFSEAMAKVTDKFGFRVTPELMEMLDEVRREEKGLPSRGKMLRILIERAAAEVRAKAKKKAD